MNEDTEDTAVVELLQAGYTIHKNTEWGYGINAPMPTPYQVGTVIRRNTDYGWCWAAVRVGSWHQAKGASSTWTPSTWTLIETKVFRQALEILTAALLKESSE